MTDNIRLTCGKSGGECREGRLEVFRDGRWGTVCRTNFDVPNVRVACNSLGFGYRLLGHFCLPPALSLRLAKLPFLRANVRAIRVTKIRLHVARKYTRAVTSLNSVKQQRMLDVYLMWTKIDWWRSPKILLPRLYTDTSMLYVNSFSNILKFTSLHCCNWYMYCMPGRWR